jgi:ABC-2 type transport system ATP-binding protein
MDEADYLCDRVGIIDYGKILVIDSIANLKNVVGNDVITLSSTDISKLQRRLKSESWISNIKQYDSQLTLGVEKGEEKIPLVVEIARKLGVRIHSINVRKPTLDDVFLSFTGRSFRDQEPENPLKETVKMYSRRR